MECIFLKSEPEEEAFLVHDTYSEEIEVSLIIFNNWIYSFNII